MEWHDSLVEAFNKLRSEDVDVRLQALPELGKQLKRSTRESRLSQLVGEAAGTVFGPLFTSQNWG